MTFYEELSLINYKFWAYILSTILSQKFHVKGLPQKRTLLLENNLRLIILGIISDIVSEIMLNYFPSFFPSENFLLGMAESNSIKLKRLIMTKFSFPKVSRNFLCEICELLLISFHRHTHIL